MVTFRVEGKPTPQGSLTSFHHASTGRVVTPQKPAVVEYRERVAWAARAAGVPLLEGPVSVWALFCFARPRSHYNRGFTALKPGVPLAHLQAPDVDKLCRSLLDALAGVAYGNDSQVVRIEGRKVWGSEHWTRIDITPDRAVSGG